jgi:cold shock CspA family protein
MSEQYEGEVKFFSKPRGAAASFGFVSTFGRTDTYFNEHILDRNGISDLRTGDAVVFTIRENSRGKPEVDKIRLRDGEPLSTERAAPVRFGAPIEE